MVDPSTTSPREGQAQSTTGKPEKVGVYETGKTVEKGWRGLSPVAIGAIVAAIIIVLLLLYFLG